MVLGRLGRAGRLVGSRVSLPTGRFGIGAVVLAAVALAGLAAFLLGLDPLASLAVFTALLAGDVLLSGAILFIAGVAGAAAAFGSAFVGASRRTVALLGAGGAAAGGAVATSTMGVPALLPAGGGVIAFIGSGLIALAVGHPFLIALVGGAGLFFLVDPLGGRGGFLESFGFALKLAATAILAYLSVTLVGPDLRALISVLPVLAAGGCRRG